MALKALIEDDLIRHEGFVGHIYLDSEGYPTFGIGHLITKQDIEYTWPVGSTVTSERVEQVFNNDLDDAIANTEKLFKDLYSHPENVQRVLVNMMFNLGYNGLSKFKKMRDAIKARDYAEAAVQMQDSKWYGQVGRRSKELCRLMEWADGS